MKQHIKPKDFVYIPSISQKVQQVTQSVSDLIIVYRNDKNASSVFYINDDGCLYNPTQCEYHKQPFAFLATHENKALLELIYGKLEDVPVDEVELFRQELAALLSAQSDSGINQHKDNLIQMFKNRGTK